MELPVVTARRAGRSGFRSMDPRWISSGGREHHLYRALILANEAVAALGWTLGAEMRWPSDLGAEMRWPSDLGRKQVRGSDNDLDLVECE